MSKIEEFFEKAVAAGIIPQITMNYHAVAYKIYTGYLENKVDELTAENAELRAKLDNAGNFQCKVGDTIYRTDTNGTRIFKSTVKDIIFETDGVAFDERAIGESIFLTEEVVKEKMKNLQEKRQ